MKRCGVCGETKPFSDFHKDARRGHSSRCKPCNLLQVRKYRARNKEALNAQERQRYATDPAKWARHLKSKYGISAETYAAMLDAQGGACAICRRTSDKKLAVDHCHQSGEVRGLLCAKCNRMLGCAGDAVGVLLAGASYLGKQKGTA